MNLSTCFMFQYFQGLSVWGKVAVIAGYILMALLIILWERSRTHRHDATTLSTVIPNSVIEEPEKFVHTITACPSKENQYNPYERARHLLETFRHNLRKPIIYCKSCADGNNVAYQCRDHIRIIVNKLTGRVNQSGKEPPFR